MYAALLYLHYQLTTLWPISQLLNGWRVWSIYQKRHCQNFSKCHSMACLINLLNNGVDGVDGFYGFNGVFDNLPLNPWQNFCLGNRQRTKPGQLWFIFIFGVFELLWERAKKCITRPKIDRIAFAFVVARNS